MQFCWAPLPPTPLYATAPLSTHHGLPQLPLSLPEQAYLYSFNNYCSQFHALSHTLTLQLQINNQLIHIRTQPGLDTVDQQETAVSDDQPLPLHSNKNTSSPAGLEVDGEDIKNKNIKKSAPQQPYSDSDSYIPQGQSSKTGVSSLGKQTKNIPKNYGKAILIFIQKNQAYVRRVLSHLDVCFRDFMRSVIIMKRKLKSIQQLKSLWLEENPFSKAYRIISIEYLRRHSLEYIFNSRVENFGNHIKYRYRIIESVGDARNFTVMKEF